MNKKNQDHEIGPRTITALSAVTSAIVGLDTEQRRRVLYAAAVLYGIIIVPGDSVSEDEEARWRKRAEAAAQKEMGTADGARGFALIDSFLRGP